MKAFITTLDGKVEVKCYPVIIPGFEKYKFIIHHVLYSDGWFVSEVSTGLSVMPPSWPGSHSNKTRAGAIAIATERLAKEKARFFEIMGAKKS